ncbi:Rap guanine nucleotide exchange factor 1 [Ilyodon furcidens]|uniref:Rap guanine nucleotide exchange factor 1 n=1 Tax=Ilyodon furcidens TaxID=33524 RepID=A0ABV0UKI6_9TELE
MAHVLHSNVLSKMEKRWKLNDSPQSLRPLAAKGVAARPGTLLDFRSQDLAEQLTLMDSELFCKIELPEVLLWSKEQNEERSPHLTEFTQHFNNVSFWVRSVIILQDKPHDREKLLLKFLKVMKVTPDDMREAQYLLVVPSPSILFFYLLNHPMLCPCST